MRTTTMTIARTSHHIASTLTNRANHLTAAHFAIVAVIPLSHVVVHIAMVEFVPLSHVVVDVAAADVTQVALKEVDGDARTGIMHRTKVHATAVEWLTTIRIPAIF